VSPAAEPAGPNTIDSGNSLTAAGPAPGHAWPTDSQTMSEQRRA
jgi:hypothetical protein